MLKAVHTLINCHVKPVSITCFIAILLFLPGYGFSSADTSGKVTSTPQEAIAFIDKAGKLAPSAHWPNIKPDLFIKNLKDNIERPIGVYAGKGTNFCGYGALTYLFLKDDPLGYAKLLLELYREGKAKFRVVNFNPSAAVKQGAGQIRYAGKLDINPAEQLWYLTLAGHFKGYVNIFNRKYDPNDQNTFWASVNYAKFNRMVSQLLNYRSRARGADLKRPFINDLYSYINERMQNGTVVLYLNNRILHKKNHTLKLAIPTHFVVAEKISIDKDIITLMYWDYGRKTQMQMSSAFFKRIIFGITYFTKNETALE